MVRCHIHKNVTGMQWLLKDAIWVCLYVCHFEISLIINATYKYHHGQTLKAQQSIICRWVKNYPHYGYMFCSWLYCWFGMTRYTRSTPLLPLWCRCDLDSPFLSWVFCHKHGQSQFHLHQRRAEGSDPFLWGEGVPGVEMHRMMSVQYGNSVMSQWIVC